jgi:hypothetical protein
MRTILSLSLLVCLAVGLSPVGGKAAEPPLVEKFLLEGKLAEGEKALEVRLQASPNDDQARFGLGVLQFLQSFEHLGGSLHKYGLRTEKAFLRPPPQVKEFLPQNPKPELLTYEASRQIVQTFVKDVVRAEATLAEIKDPAVTLPLRVGLIKIDPFGQDKPISAAFLFERVEGLPASSQQAEEFVIGLDRGDVHWLRGYCHFLAALGEMCLAVDGQKSFECTAHLLFEKVETPHTFLLESRRALDENPLANRAAISDAISFLHQLTRLSIKEPARLKAALAHLEAGVAQGKQLWKFVLAETDNDREWIPNPKQASVIGVQVTQEMVDAWLETLDETEQVLQGKKLIPFWRGEMNGRGVNLRRVFTEPQPTFDVIEWMQGTAATPYLENGPLTKFADPGTGTRLNNAFGGPMEFAAFGFWFN